VEFNVPLSILTGTKHPAFSTNHLTDIDKHYTTKNNHTRYLPSHVLTKANKTKAWIKSLLSHLARKRTGSILPAPVADTGNTIVSVYWTNTNYGTSQLKKYLKTLS